MKIKNIIICENNPFPPRDGVSVAVNSLINHLNFNGSTAVYIESEERLFLEGAFYEKKISEVFEEFDFNFIFASPINSALNFISKKNNIESKKIAFLSDCYTYVLWRQIVLLIRFNFFKLSKVPLLMFKIIYYYLQEKKIAKNYDLIILQTSKDVSVFNKLFNVKNTFSLPNIPDFSTSDDRKIKAASKRIGFVATFNSSYSVIAHWFITKVWSEVIKTHPDARLHLLGSGNNEFANKFNSKEFLGTIITEGYHHRLSDFYDEIDFSIAPIFKGYGLINKTVESMALGCPVLGDKEAFNGIQGVCNNENCFIANTKEEFINSINHIFSLDEEEKQKVRKKGIKLIESSFNFLSHNINLKEELKLLIND